MAARNKKQSLSEKISNLITATPTNFVEKFDEFESDDDNEISTQSSSIRRKNVDLLDEIDDRYRGKKISKKDIYGNDSDEFDGDEDDENEDDDDGEASAQSENESVQDGESNDDDDDDDDDKDEEEAEGEDESDIESQGSNSEGDEVDDENPLYRKRGDDKNFKNMTVNNPRNDIEKGNCVREQLKLWENLLEIRIHLQKCLASSNKLPQFDTHKEYAVDREFAKSKNQTRNKLMDLLEKMLQVQDKLLKINPETNSLSDQTHNKSNEESKVEDDPMDEEICSDTEDEMEKNDEAMEGEQSEIDSAEPVRKKRKTLAEYEKILEDNHQKYIPHRNSVIQLWNDKTRLASGHINKSTSQSVVKQIEFILNDKSKVIRKSQLKRSEYEIIGKKSQNVTNEVVENKRHQEYDPEIYDDDDFYHQLLRELIQHKSADVTDPIQLSKQWIQLQNMRNKMKRKVDTKESKGRRIRYGQIHNKLVNFMAPITIDDTWSSSAKTELYNSLFGKIQSLDSNTNNKIVVHNE